MPQFGDDIYLGYFVGTQALNINKTGQGRPTSQNGVGPMGRVAFYEITPLTLGTANIAALQAQTAATALTLTAGTGVTLGIAPDGSGNAVLVFDVPRCVSLTSASNLSAGTFTIVGYDTYGQRMTSLTTGPNAATVTTLKAFASVLSVTPNTTSASTVSVGSSDVFGLPYVITDAGFLIRTGWAGSLTDNIGTFVAADTTNPATSSTGDVRGTFKPTTASNGTNLLIIGMHLTGVQCGPQPSVIATIGVTNA